MFYKTKEVAEKFSVTKQTINNMVSRGEIKPVNDDPRYFLFDKKQIDDCLILKSITSKKRYFLFNAKKIDCRILKRQSND